MRAIAIAAALLGCGGGHAVITPVTRAVHPVGAPWGAAVPTNIIEMPPDGRWWVACQARADTTGDGKIVVEHALHGEEKGDRMVAYLVDPAGRETVIDAVLTADRAGRWLVVVEAGKPVLLDTQTWRREPLAGELPHFSIVRGRHEWSIDPSGKRLLYFRDHAPIVRDLATGAERAVVPAAWRATWNIDGSWVILDVLERGDTDHDGFVHGPDHSPQEGLGTSNCGRTFHWDDVFGELAPPTITSADVDRVLASMQRADALTRKLWRASDGLLVTTAETALDHDTLITRRPDGALGWGPVNGIATELVACRGEIISTFVAAGSVLVTCPIDVDPSQRRGATREAGRSIDDKRTQLVWARGNRREQWVIADDTVFASDSNHAFVGISQASLVLDMRSGAVVSRVTGHALDWTDGEHVVIVHRRPGDQDGVPWTAELRSGKRRIALPSRGANPWTHSAGRFIVHHATRVNLDTGEALTLPVVPIRVRSDGAVLLDGGPQLIEDSAYEPHLGPLRWVAP